MQVNLASEMNVLAREFHLLAMRDRRTRDFTLNGMLAALEEVVAAFPVYRTYVSHAGASADDRRYIDWAIGQARNRWRGADDSIFDFLRAVSDRRGRGTGARSQPGQRIAYRDALSAGDRSGHGQGRRGHRLLPLRPAVGAERSRRRSAPLRHVGRRFSSPGAAARPAMAACDGDDRDARYQARRGRSRPPRAVVGDAGRMGPPGVPMVCGSIARDVPRSTVRTYPIAMSNTCSIRRCSGRGRPGSLLKTSTASTASPSGSRLT